MAAALRSALADRIGHDRYDVWFGAEVSLACRGERVEVTAADEFQLEQLRRRFACDLETVGRTLLGGSLVVDFTIDSAAELTSGEGRGGLATCAAKAPSGHGGRAVSFSRGARPLRLQRADEPRAPEPAQPERNELLPFVVGDENRVASTSAEMVLENPGRATPLFVYGPTGCGKSHLLETIRYEAKRRKKLKRVVHVSAEQFTTQFLDALHGSGLPNFRRKYRDVELLLIDDLHFFVGKRSTLTELQNTIDVFLRDRRQLVLAADRSPAELTGLNAELRGRMSGGLVCHMAYPERATRRRIVEHLAERHGGLASDVLDLLADRLTGDTRQLQGAVNRLTAYRQAHGAEITRALAEAALVDLFQAARPIVRLSDIEEAICEVFGLEKNTLLSERKEKVVSQPRMLAMWLARKHTRAGLSEICRYFGRRSHSTVVSAERNVNRWVSDKSAIRMAQGECSIEDAIRRVESKLRTG